MTDPRAPLGEPPESGAAASRWTPSAGGRVAAIWHRVRSGEDPLAFGAVVAVLGLVAGLVWFWAGARHGGVAAASASPGPAASAAARAAGKGSGRSSADPALRGPDEGGGATPADSPLPADSTLPADRALPAPGDSGGPPAASRPVTTGPVLAVHVAGAVTHPGLYHLPAGSRVADAVALAGGGLPRADLDRLNLAARLLDGQRVYVTRRGEPVPPEPAAAGIADGVGDDEGASGAAEPIDLNAAGLAALDSLPGVGPATARAILEERARRGGFRSTRDLLHVPGIGEGRFARLKDHIRV